jgi:hypothetical protein
MPELIFGGLALMHVQIEGLDAFIEQKVEEAVERTLATRGDDPWLAGVVVQSPSDSGRTRKLNPSAAAADADRDGSRAFHVRQQTRGPPHLVGSWRRPRGVRRGT